MVNGVVHERILRIGVTPNVISSLVGPSPRAGQKCGFVTFVGDMHATTSPSRLSSIERAHGRAGQGRPSGRRRVALRGPVDPAWTTIGAEPARPAPCVRPSWLAESIKTSPVDRR